MLVFDEFIVVILAIVFGLAVLVDLVCRGIAHEWCVSSAMIQKDFLGTLTVVM